MKHINKFCTSCNTNKSVEDWHKNKTQTDGLDVICKSCRKNYNSKRNPEYSPIHNSRRMYVNGKYVPKKHPLYKAGRFKTFEGAAFSSLKGYKKTTEGYVYIIANPSFDGWLKIGMAIDAEDRCNSYQTSSPHRDYRLLYARRFNDRRKAETKTMNKLKKVVKEYNGEWFKTDRNTAQEIIERLSITL